MDQNSWEHSWIESGKIATGGLLDQLFQLELRQSYGVSVPTLEETIDHFVQTLDMDNVKSITQPEEFRISSNAELQRVMFMSIQALSRTLKDDTDELTFHAEVKSMNDETIGPEIHQKEPPERYWIRDP